MEPEWRTYLKEHSPEPGKTYDCITAALHHRKYITRRAACARCKYAFMITVPVPEGCDVD